MRIARQIIAVACFCLNGIWGVLQIDAAEAAAPETLCDRYLSSSDNANAFHPEVSPAGVLKRMELVLPECKAALVKFPNDGRIHTLLARLYGIRRETALAFHHAKTAAELDYPYGAYLMGLFYARGDGVTKDLAESVRWMKKSAELGSPRAMEQVAKAYIFGQGVQKDPKAARNWFTKAARAGLNQAFVSLGYLYQEGIGVERNFKYALIYYTEAKRRRVKGAEAQIEALKQKADKAGYPGLDKTMFSEFDGYGVYEVFASGAEKNKKMREVALFIGEDSKPKRELTPEGWDWYENRFDPKNKS